jgi:hypothetical protein
MNIRLKKYQLLTHRRFSQHNLFGFTRGIIECIRVVRHGSSRRIESFDDVGISYDVSGTIADMFAPFLDLQVHASQTNKFGFHRRLTKVMRVITAIRAVRLSDF